MIDLEQSLISSTSNLPYFGHLFTLPYLFLPTETKVPRCPEIFIRNFFQKWPVRHMAKVRHITGIIDFNQRASVFCHVRIVSKFTVGFWRMLIMESNGSLTLVERSINSNRSSEILERSRTLIMNLSYHQIDVIRTS